MGWYGYLAPTGGGTVTETNRLKLDHIIRQLPTFIRYEASTGQYVMVDPEWCAVIEFTPDGMKIWWDDWTDQWAADLLRLIRFGRTIDLVYFDEPGKEKSIDKVEQWLTPKKGL